MNEKIEQYVRNHGRDFMEWLCDIISIPSPTGHEQAKGEWILNLLHQWGAAGAYRDAAGNVVYPCHVKSGEKVALYTAHIDTVFQDLQEIHIRQTGHILSAPSCSDNSASIAGLLFIIKMFHDLQLTPPQGLLFAFDVGEEGLGNLKGMRQVMADWHGRIAEVVAVDCTFDTFVTTAVGSRRYAVTVEAAGGHSWMHFGQSNAIAEAARIISQLYALSVPSQPKTTYNVGTITGGTTVNSIRQRPCSLSTCARKMLMNWTSWTKLFKASWPILKGKRSTSKPSCSANGPAVAWTPIPWQTASRPSGGATACRRRALPAAPMPTFPWARVSRPFPSVSAAATGSIPFRNRWTSIPLCPA